MTELEARLVAAAFASAPGDTLSAKMRNAKAAVLAYETDVLAKAAAHLRRRAEHFHAEGLHSVAADFKMAADELERLAP
jgi:predicted negative regulator of RcsB-dependent stress response